MSWESRRRRWKRRCAISRSTSARPPSASTPYRPGRSAPSPAPAPATPARWSPSRNAPPRCSGERRRPRSAAPRSICSRTSRPASLATSTSSIPATTSSPCRIPARSRTKPRRTRAPSPRTRRSSLRFASAPRLRGTARSNRHRLNAAETKRRPAGRLCDIPREREFLRASRLALLVAALLLGFGGLLLRLQILAGRLVDDLHGEAHLAALVEAEKLDLDLVAFLDDVGDLLHPARRELADVHE